MCDILKYTMKKAGFIMERYPIEDFLGEFSRETYMCDLGTIPYRLHLPESGTENKPIVLFMHGAGERGTDNELPLRAAIEVFVRSNEEVRDAIYILPQCPCDEQWVMTPWNKVSYSVDEVPESWENKVVLRILEKVLSETKADRDRVYVMGISMGGFATWDLIMRHNDIFAAAMPICGGGDPTKASLLKDIPIRTFHGDLDDSVPVEGTREMASALKAVGCDIVYTEFPGVNHWSWDRACSSEGIGAWMFSNRRKSK